MIGLVKWNHCLKILTRRKFLIQGKGHKNKIR